MSRRTSPLAPTALIAAVLAAPVWADPPDAGTLLREQQQQQGQRQPPLLPEREKPAGLLPLPAPQGRTVQLRAVTFDGAVKLLGEPALQSLVQDAIGQPLDLRGLQVLALRVSARLREQGYLLADAYLPPQDLSDGTLHIVLRPGQFDRKAFELQAAPELRASPERLQRMAQRLLRPGEATRGDDIEQLMLLMNDLPALNAKARLAPGEDAGATRVFIDVKQGPAWAGSVRADNEGNRDTGSAQAHARLQLADALGYSEQFAMGISAAQGLRLAQGGASLPLGYAGARIALNATAMRYRILSGVGEDAGLKGSTNGAELSLTQPLLRSRLLNAGLRLGLSYTALIDDSAAGNLRDVHRRGVELALSLDGGDGWGGGGFSNVQLACSLSWLDLSRNAADAAADAQGYATQGRAAHCDAGAQRLQRLPGAFSLLMQFDAQWAQRNLGTSDKFALGGLAGVPAWSGNEGIGDSGWRGGVELRWAALQSEAWGALQATASLNAGQVRLHQDPGSLPIATATGLNQYSLSAWGLGLTLSKPQSHQIRLVWAHRIGTNPGRNVQGLDADGRESRARVWLSADRYF